MASGFTVATNEHLIRSDVWSRQLKQLLLDDLQAMRFVRTLDFGEGTTLHIPSLGEAETADFAEGQAVKYNKFDTGEFTFTVDQYKVSANAISEKFKRDSFYSAEVIAAFLPRQHRALMEQIEVRIFNRMNAGQTASNLNTWNSADHRFVGTGTSNTLALKDFAKAWYALKKANVPMTNLCAIIDPSQAYNIKTQALVTAGLSPNPRWQMAVHEDIVTGLQFQFNLYGFDVYVSNYLPDGIAETVNSVSVTTGVANLFFSATPGDTQPSVFAWRQHPTVYSEFNKDLQQTEYLTIMEYGTKLYRPENLVVVLTDKVIL